MLAAEGFPRGKKLTLILKDEKLMHTRHITLVATVMLLASKVYPYSHDGHYLVGAIADQMLAGTPTAAKIQGLIGDVTLASSLLK